MKRIVSYILMIVIILGMPRESFAHLEDALNYVADNDVVQQRAIEDAKLYYGIENYFPDEGKNERKLYMYYKQAGVESEQTSYYFGYGEPEHGDYSDELELHQYLGYNYEGNDKVYNPPYGWEEWWNGRKLENWGQVKKPWDQGLCEKGDFDNQDLPSGAGIKDLEENIQMGLNMIYGGRNYSKIHASRPEGDNREVYTVNAKPIAGGLWREYVHISVLPTDLTWGQGYMYQSNGRKVPIPIAPFKFVKPDFIPTIFSPFEITGAYNTDPVYADVEVGSTFQKDKMTSYQWMIKGEKSGKLYHQSEETQCVFTGYGEAANGATTIPGSETKLKATFTVNFIMPDESVRVIFIINPNKNPEDKEENNKVELTIKGLHYEVQEAQYILNYDELSKDIEHNLAGGSISGELDPPGNDGYWHQDYNMTGGLPIDINVSALGGRTALQGANVKEGTNEPVDEPSTSVTRSPIIKGKIVRPDYHDDPEGGMYHANGEVVNKMIAYYNKSRGNNLSRVYRYHYDHSVRSGTDSKGNPTYSTCTSCSSVYATATGNGRFQPGEDKIAIKALIYNGRADMPHVDARDFLKEIEDNTSDSLNKTIYWESEKYPMIVQHWMKHVTLEDKKTPEPIKDDEGNETGEMKDVITTETKDEWVPVEGQYKRIFSHQNKAEIKWGTNESLQQAYAEDRSNAANRKRDKGSYEKAPFATDRELQGYDYPFKSGYYFNPAGEYTLTIHTEIYKDEQKETEEHKALVDRLIESFRYGSTMKYIDTDRLLLAIDDASVGDTVYSDDKFLEVEKDYQYVKDFEIPHWPDESGYTHDYFKEILEGHEESNTGDSKADYNYKEYIKEGDIFRIIEETTITFKVNPDNMNRYTYGGMKNGIYYNTVWAEDTDLSDITKVKNMKLIGVNKDTPLDLMEITVQGSMYDDLNNN